MDNHKKEDRGTRDKCQRPWDCGERTVAGKKHRSDAIYALFALISPVANSNTNQSTISEAKSPVHGCSLDDSFLVASGTDAKRKPPTPTPTNKNKKKRGATKLFDNDNRMTHELTTLILESLKGRTSLEDHEAEVLQRLADINPTIRKQSVLTVDNTMTPELTNLLTDSLDGRSVLEDHEKMLLDKLITVRPLTMKDTLIADNNVLKVEVTKVLTAALKGRSELDEHETRLLGQLAVIAFKTKTDVGSIGFLNFPSCQKIQLVCLPRQYKQGDELDNKRLFESRIETGKKLVSLLPESFHSELVAALFLEIDREKACEVLKMFHNKFLRLDDRDSASLKNFVGLNDAQYVRLMRSLYYFAGMRIFAPMNTLYQLRRRTIEEDYTTLVSRPVVMTRKVRKGKDEIIRKIRVVVTTIRPLECVLTTVSSLLRNGKLLDSKLRFHSPVKLHENFKDIILEKVSADKGGGSSKMIVNTVNVEKPQSLKHVRPVMEFTANDSPENMRAAAFEKDSPIRADVEDIIHRRCILIRVKIGTEEQVVLVKNSNAGHHRSRPTPLPTTVSIEEYYPILPAQEFGKKLDHRIAVADVTMVKSTQLLYQRNYKAFVGLRLVDESGNQIAVAYFKQAISCLDPSVPPFSIEQYLIAGVFTGDLDFYAKFLGHQGASAKWLCMFCLAMQDQLKDVFISGGTAARFQKCTIESIKRMHGIYKEKFESLPTCQQTKAKREEITKEMTYSVVGEALADIPLDCFTPASMHVILGFTKKIVDWIKALFAKLESLEEMKSKGRTLFQLRQGVEEAYSWVIEYEEFLRKEFQGVIQYVEAKKKQIDKHMKSIAKAAEKVSNLPPGQMQEKWIAKLEELRTWSEQNKTTEEEVEAGMHFVEQLHITCKTKEYLKKVLDKHQGDSAREFIKAMKNNKVDQQVYHSGMIVGNHCMAFGENGGKIVNELTMAMKPKIKDAENLGYLTETATVMKNIIRLWFELMLVMKSKRCQTEETIKKFKETTIELTKAIQNLIVAPPVPGCELKYSKQLKSHLLFDGEIHDFLSIWGTLGALDEQNTKGVHPQFNNLYRRFGNSRGAFQKAKIVREFLFEREDWMIETVDQMLAATGRKKKLPINDTSHDDSAVVEGEDMAVEPEVEEEVEETTPISAGGLLEVGEEEMEEGVGGEIGTADAGDGEVIEEEEDPTIAVGELSALERQINGNFALHGMPHLNTRVHACKKCSIRLLDFAMKIHCHESHYLISVDADGMDE